MIKPTDKLCWIMKPGYGSECLRLGQMEPDVQALLGRPESITRKYEGQYFWNYPGLGLEVDFGKRGGNVEYLFFFRDGFRGNHQGMMETDRGIKPGDSREKVLELLGPPSDEGQAFCSNIGLSVDAWFEYKGGINFQFDLDGTVNMITIAPAST